MHWLARTSLWLRLHNLWYNFNILRECRIYSASPMAAAALFYEAAVLYSFSSSREAHSATWVDGSVVDGVGQACCAGLVSVQSARGSKAVSGSAISVPTKSGSRLSSYFSSTSSSPSKDSRNAKWSPRSSFPCSEEPCDPSSELSSSPSEEVALSLSSAPLAPQLSWIGSSHWLAPAVALRRRDAAAFLASGMRERN